MIEEVAKAIAERMAAHDGYNLKWENQSAARRDKYMDLAVPAIHAMKIPTQKMLNAAIKKVGYEAGRHAGTIWEEMIYASLREDS